MGKKKPTKAQPFVSIITPTFNRRPFIPTMIECYKNQTYPKNRMEWIIVDDGSDKIEDLIKKENFPADQVKYFSLPQKVNLGKKRNICHQHSKGSILVYMDDDDYYPPERVSHAVEMLLTHPEAMAAGSSEIYIYFKHIQKMYQFGPYMPNHATAGTFAFRRELLNESAYQDEAAIAEERAFLKNYTVPMVQLDPLKTILVFSHIHNTYDKKKLLETPDPRTVKESPKTVDMFIRYESEAAIKKYFLKDIDKQLANYDPGDPKWKPEVFEQMKVIQKERDEMVRKMQLQQQQQMMQQQQQQGDAKIMINEEGKPPRELTAIETLQLIQQMQDRINALEAQVKQTPTANQNTPMMFQNTLPPQAPQAPAQFPFQNTLPPQSPAMQNILQTQQSKLLEDRLVAFEMENKYLKERIAAIQTENKGLKVKAQQQTQQQQQQQPIPQSQPQIKVPPPPGLTIPFGLPEFQIKSEPEITLTF